MDTPLFHPLVFQSTIEYLFESDNVDEVISRLDTLYNNFNSFLIKKVPKKKFIYEIQDPHYKMTVNQKLLFEKDPFYNLYQNQEFFLIALFQKNIVNDVFSHYINHYTHDEKSSFHSILNFYKVSHYNKKLPFSFIEQFLETINKDYLVASSHWEKVYYHENKTSFEMTESFVKKYKPFINFQIENNIFKSMVDFNYYKDSQIISLLLEQNPHFFAINLPYLVSLIRNNNKNPELSHVFNFIESEFYNIYNNAEPLLKENLKLSFSKITDFREEGTKENLEIILDNIKKIDQNNFLNQTLVKNNKSTNINKI